MPFPPLLIILVVAGVIAAIVAIVYGSVQSQKRRDRLMVIASQLGLRFDPGRDRDHDEQFSQFEIFRRGRDRSAFNTIWGTVQLAGRRADVRMGDFRYTTDSGSSKNRSSTVHRFSYFICEVPFPRTSDLLIRTENLFDKIAGVFSGADIDFESSEFSRRFYVASSDRRFAYDVIHPRMMEFLLETDPDCIDIEYGRLCMTRGQSRWKPEQFSHALGWADAFLSRWPEHLIRKLEAS